jgi:hypothetical protein
MYRSCLSVCSIALGQIAQGEAHVEDLIVEGEVAHGYEVETRLFAKMAGSEFRSDG